MPKSYHERMADERVHKAEHRAKLEKTYGVVGHPKAERLYELAYEEGHAAGDHEIEYYYSVMVELIQ